MTVAEQILATLVDSMSPSHKDALNMNNLDTSGSVLQFTTNLNGKIENLQVQIRKLNSLYLVSVGGPSKGPYKMLCNDKTNQNLASHLFYVLNLVGFLSSAISVN